MNKIKQKLKNCNKSQNNVFNNAPFNWDGEVVCKIKRGQ